MSALFLPLDVSTLSRPDEPFSLNVAEEVPVSLLFNGIFPYGTMMMTPADLKDFAYGYCMTERIVASVADIRSVDVAETQDGLSLDISIKGAALTRLMRRDVRMRTGHSSCGICGSETVPAYDAVAATPLPDGPRLSVAAIRGALHELRGWQTLNAATRMVHAAAWADRNGNIHMIREDVGRHNALDKLIGARACHPDADALHGGFCLLTSRYSFEMALKTIRAGIAVVVAISAPTYRAFRAAEKMDQTLIAVARHDGQTLFCGGRRLVW
ncbi:Protein fdhD-like protein [Gluconacetobacter sp. SXCC-1]|uniref:formate dehydrogenase accessory sulfurtransferase FdhD n=1 Tax=Komagataeibacter rhaeticus TaxID=215221 RepID=UPI000207FADA|nr:formate dehydrogenase accessory sulfurtransferase FdhD [Komagataeibacter rhaeticus]ATU73325.1 sulfurtransferase FdhD [Komagataeibacter xylinus]EGG75703.1 Protein fdhD-like protein [Gluconacetobacter sp. SXCC-1]WPP23218.1 formate dehydrogenase accessory sulfurtransferase FdhD [Komagataeibacter rhaeticus]